jgi:hypothetical protein
MITASLALWLIQPTPPPTPRVMPPAPAAAAEAPILGEARTFMAGYARDLIAGDRAAVSARYDRRGAYVVVGGAARHEAYSAIAAEYHSPRWSALPRFQWHDLMYIPTASDSIVVAGRFSVQPDGRPDPIFFSYSNLLVRQDGVLRIRMEHETPEPAPRRPETR